jgi:membrane protease YdiL (CAAX protease family)
MLSVKPWRAEAVVRLGAGIFICFCGGLLVRDLLPHAGGAAKVGFGFLLLVWTALFLLGASLFLLRKPWTHENLTGRALRLMICFYAAVVLGFCAEKLAGKSVEGSAVQTMLVSGLSFQGAALLLIALFVRQHPVRWNEAWGFSNHWPQAVLLGAAVACIFFPIGWFLQRVSWQLMQHVPPHPIQPGEQDAVHALRIASSWADRVALGVVTIFLAPPAEEMLFRGILYPAIKQRGFPRLALWVTSLVFAAMHVTQLEHLDKFVPLFVLSVFLTVLYEKTDNLLAPITAHALFNGMGLLNLYLQQRSMGL